MAAGVFAAEQIKLNLVDLLSTAADPTAGGGVAAAIGSFYLRSGTAGSFLKTGAGNTAWTSLSSSFAWYSVRDYGAVGDGVTDDRAAIAAAIAACDADGGGCVYFPRGTYACSKDGANPYSFLVNVDRITFRGSGPASIIRQVGSGASNPWQLFRMEQGSQNRFEDLVFDGGGVTNPHADDHLFQVGVGTGAVTELQFFRCTFQNTVVGAGDGVHVEGAAGFMVSRLWVDDCVFQSISGNGVGIEQGLEYFWLVSSYMTGCAREISAEATASETSNSWNIFGNEIVHTNASDHIAVLLEGDATGLITRLIFSHNIVIGGFVAMSNIQWSSNVGNVQTSGAYATTDPVWHIYGAVLDYLAVDNLIVRSTGATAGPCIAIELANGTSPGRTAANINRLFNEVTGGTFIRIVDSSQIVANGNICRGTNAGGGTAYAIDLQAVAADVNDILFHSNQVSAAAGSYGAMFRTLVNGSNIDNFAIVNNMGGEIAYGWRAEDAGGGSFIGRQMLAGNAFDSTTGDYQEVGVTLYPHIGTNASTFGAVMRTGNGSPEGQVTARIGSMYLRRDGGQDTTLYYKESGTGATGWIAVGGSALVFGGASMGTVATALYLAPGYTSGTIGATQLQFAVSRAGILRNFYVRVTGAGTDAGNVTYTVRVNGVDTALAAVLDNTATGTASDLVDTVTVAAGDLISISVVKAGVVTAGQTDVFASLELV